MPGDTSTLKPHLHPNFLKLHAFQKSFSYILSNCAPRYKCLFRVAQGDLTMEVKKLFALLFITSSGVLSLAPSYGHADTISCSLIAFESSSDTVGKVMESQSAEIGKQLLTEIDLRVADYSTKAIYLNGQGYFAISKDGPSGSTYPETTSPWIANKKFGVNLDAYRLECQLTSRSGSDLKVLGEIRAKAISAQSSLGLLRLLVENSDPGLGVLCERIGELKPQLKALQAYSAPAVEKYIADKAQLLASIRSNEIATFCGMNPDPMLSQPIFPVPNADSNQLIEKLRETSKDLSDLIAMSSTTGIDLPTSSPSASAIREEAGTASRSNTAATPKPARKTLPKRHRVRKPVPVKPADELEIKAPNLPAKIGALTSPSPEAKPAAEP
jgi:hypothetical protein